MVTVCAWCDRYLGVTDHREKALVSHGICDACVARQGWKSGPTLVVSREHEGLAPVLNHLLRGYPHIQVVIDRRQADRRRIAAAGPPRERRGHEDRRRGSPVVLT